HARAAYESRQAHRAAAADKDPAASFGQRVVGGTFRHADVARRGNLQTAAHHRTVQDGNHRCPPEFDALEGAMPAARMSDGLADVARGELVEVEPGTEVLALAGQHD